MNLENKTQKRNKKGSKIQGLDYVKFNKACQSASGEYNTKSLL